jgi:hypothetical protein
MDDRDENKKDFQELLCKYKKLQEMMMVDDKKWKWKKNKLQPSIKYCCSCKKDFDSHSCDHHPLLCSLLKDTLVYYCSESCFVRSLTV